LLLEIFMDCLDPAAERLRLSEHYRQMTDGELISLARQTSELTDGAQQALAQEITTRRLTIPPAELPVPRNPVRPPDLVEDQDSAYAEDRKLVTVCEVWSFEDALKLQHLLDVAGIPFYIGPEKATGVETVTSNFATGLDVQIMNVGMPWAHLAMQNYFPKDEPPEEKPPEPDNLAVHCPRCHSTDVVLEDRERGPADPEEKVSKFQWSCDSCGCGWEDDGLVTE
jgi:hypothetical protein